MEAPKRKATRCCFCDGRLVVGFDDGLIKFWDVRVEKWDETIDQHQQEITALCHQNGDVMSASRDGIITVWDTHQGVEKCRYNIGKPMFVASAVLLLTRRECCRYVPNGKMILVTLCDGDAFFLRTDNCTHSQHFHNFTNGVTETPFDFITDTREGHYKRKFVVSSDCSGSVNMWSVETMKCASSMPTASAHMTALACHPTEMLLITGGDISDTSIRLWK